MNEHMAKCVTYKNNNYDIDYTRTQERNPNGKVENIISVMLQNGKALPKSYSKTFTNDNMDIEQMVKETLDSYLNEYTETLSMTQKFKYWNGKLDEYQG